MTEKEFWAYCYKRAKEGRPMGGHVMPDLPKEKIIELGDLLKQKGVSTKARETILISLAHIQKNMALDILKEYNKRPDEDVKIFAELALDECEMWNEK